MTECAPAAMALVMSPDCVMPPSAMRGTPVLGRDFRAVHDRRDLRHANAGDDARGAYCRRAPMPTLMASAPGRD